MVYFTRGWAGGRFLHVPQMREAHAVPWLRWGWFLMNFDASCKYNSCIYPLGMFFSQSVFLCVSLEGGIELSLTWKLSRTSRYRFGKYCQDLSGTIMRTLQATAGVCILPRFVMIYALCIAAGVGHSLQRSARASGAGFREKSSMIHSMDSTKARFVYSI